MKVLKGMSISRGVVKGTITLYSTTEEANIPHYSIEEKDIPYEIEKFERASQRTQKIIEGSAKLAEKLLDKRARDIFVVHLMILKDASLNQKIKDRIKNSLVNAEHAVNDIFDDVIEEYKQKEAHFAELSQDFLEIKDKLLSAFKNAKGSFTCKISDSSRIIMASEYLTLDSILNLPDNHISGIIVNECGYTSHAAILARSLGIPTISGINVKEELNCNDRALVDADKGVLYINPDTRTLEQYGRRIKSIRTDLTDLHYQPLLTRNKKKIRLKVNVNALSVLNTINLKQTDGVGLFRTEFVFLNNEFIPDAETQYQVYKQVAESAGGREVVIRLLDIDSDKIPHYLPVLDKNIDLGIRGARAVELYTEFYEKQMEALFITAMEHKNIKILYPMVSEFSDLLIYKKLYDKYKKKMNLKNNPQQGVLIEVPSAAIISSLILEHVDFINIGSNDLLQYTLASDRTNPLIQKRYHMLHPSLIYLFDLVVKNSRKYKKEVCLCGESASIERFHPFLMNIGLESFSVSPQNYTRIRQKIRNSDYKKIDPEQLLHLKEYKDIEKIIKQ